MKRYYLVDKNQIQTPMNLDKITGEKGIEMFFMQNTATDEYYLDMEVGEEVVMFIPDCCNGMDFLTKMNAVDFLGDEDEYVKNHVLIKMIFMIHLDDGLGGAIDLPDGGIMTYDINDLESLRSVVKKGYVGQFAILDGIHVPTILSSKLLEDPNVTDLHPYFREELLSEKEYGEYLEAKAGRGLKYVESIDSAENAG